MPDEAPRSSQKVRRALARTALPGAAVDRLSIITEVSNLYRAVTTVERPMCQYAAQQQQWDEVTQKALRSLPGADPSIIITMGRAFTVEWAGICRPV